MNNPQPRKPRKIHAVRGTSNGSLLKTRLNEAHYTALVQVKEILADVSGLTFSATVILRRACERYCREIAALSPDALAAEAKVLSQRFR